MRQEWFEMQAERRRPYAMQTWIPLRAFEGTREGDIARLGYQKDLSCAVSVAVPAAHRAAVEDLEWGDSGLSNTRALNPEIDNLLWSVVHKIRYHGHHSAPPQIIHIPTYWILHHRAKFSSAS